MPSTLGTPGIARHLRSLLWIALAAVLPAAARAQGVHTALSPALQVVAPGDTFFVTFDCTQAGSVFNGFEMVVSYDPAALTFLPRAPLTLQEGTYMRGACGNTFHHFAAAGDSLAVTDVLLCNAVALPGPGQLYAFRFRASSLAQVTSVHVRSVLFYNDGAYVDPVTTADATVAIGVSLDGGPGGAVRGLSLRASPNPGRGAVALAIHADAAGTQAVTVTDVAGRIVRHLGAGWFAAGARTVAWDGRDDGGMPARSGVYLVALEAAGHSARTRVTLLR